MAKHNDAGGGMSVKEAVITSAKIVAIVGFLYIVIYFLSIVLLYSGIRGFAEFLIGTLHLYPNRAPGDLNIWHIQDMARTVLYLCAVFIPVVLYRKIKRS